MTTIMVLGADGVMGRSVAAELLRSSDALVVLAGRDQDRVDWLTEILGGGSSRVRSACFDLAASEAAVNAISANGVSTVVSAAGPAAATEEAGINAALGARASYVSLCSDHETAVRAQALDAAARAAGCTVVSGSGLSPGITTLLAVLAAHDLDEVEDVEVSLAASSSDSHGPASSAQFLKTLHQDRPHDEAGGRTPKLVYFPEPLGWVETFDCAHAELLTLKRALPSTKSMSVRIGLAEKAVMDVARLSATTRLTAAAASRLTWTRLLTPARRLFEAFPARGRSWSGARVDVRGVLSGRHRTVSYGLVDHLVNLATIPLAQTALELGRGASKPGVQGISDVVDPRVFLEVIAGRGVRVAELEPYSL